MVPAPSIEMPKRLTDLTASDENGIVILRRADGIRRRRVLFVNAYGGRKLWEDVSLGRTPPHHLWGCVELAHLGYEVAIPEPIPDFSYRRSPLPHDLRLFAFARSWLKNDGILYCAHNVLFWLPFLRRFGAVRYKVVSLLYARETLDSSNGHDGILALNPAAADHAQKLAPKAKVKHVGWGADLSFFPRLPYQPEFLLSCGITYRDHKTLASAAEGSVYQYRLIVPHRPEGVKWSSNVEIIEGGKGINTDEKTVTFNKLLNEHYRKAAASLIITGLDVHQVGACGFTNLIEAMAMGRPVILTKTGSLATEIDIEQEGFGLWVPPNDPIALGKAIDSIMSDPERAAAMGARGRSICEERYTIGRFASDLDTFFQSL